MKKAIKKYQKCNNKKCDFTGTIEDMKIKNTTTEISFLVCPKCNNDGFKNTKVH